MNLSINYKSRIIFAVVMLFITFNRLEAQIEEAENKVQETIWHVKAFKPNAELIDIKAIDKDGKIHNIKAIQNSDDTSILDVKAFVNGKRLPVKLLVNEYDRYMPLKAIDDDGTIINVKGITKEGEILDVKGISKSGNIINIRAISKNGERYSLIAISPSGRKNDVKGIKLFDKEVETVIHGIKIFAHVKSITQRN